MNSLRNRCTSYLEIFSFVCLGWSLAEKNVWATDSRQRQSVKIKKFTRAVKEVFLRIKKQAVWYWNKRTWNRTVTQVSFMSDRLLGLQPLLFLYHARWRLQCSVVHRFRFSDRLNWLMLVRVDLCMWRFMGMKCNHWIHFMENPCCVLQGWRQRHCGQLAVRLVAVSISYWLPDVSHRGCCRD
jgi:hypothetical protein